MLLPLWTCSLTPFTSKWGTRPLDVSAHLELYSIIQEKWAAETETFLSHLHEPIRVFSGACQPMFIRRSTVWSFFPHALDISLWVVPRLGLSQLPRIATLLNWHLYFSLSQVTETHVYILFFPPLFYKNVWLSAFCLTSNLLWGDKSWNISGDH